jgi:hypothetical protein
MDIDIEACRLYRAHCIAPTMFWEVVA